MTNAAYTLTTVPSEHLERACELVQQCEQQLSDDADTINPVLLLLARTHTEIAQAKQRHYS